MNKIYFMLLAVTLIVAGCSNNNDKKASKEDPIEQKLKGVPLSEELTLSESAMHCDLEEVAVKLGEHIELASDSKSPAQLWQSCQQLYACGAVTRAAITGWFGKKDTFKLGIADIKGLDLPGIGNRAEGLQVGKTSKIYLDQSITSLRRGCFLLMHELAHRFDDRLQSGGEGESLSTEYHAYWYQTAFEDEMNRISSDQAFAAVSDSGEVQMLKFETRESLLNLVAELYGFKPDLSVINGYDMLPNEKFVKSLEEQLKSSLDPSIPLDQEL